MLSLNKLACDIAQSEIRVMTVECDKVRGVNLAQGICDTPVPDVVRRAAEEAMDRGLNIYVRLDGIAPLRAAIAQKMKSYNGISADPDTQVIVTNGSSGAFYTACLALLEPGDEVILFEPYYGYHYHTLVTMQAVPRFIRLESPEWSFSHDDLARAITSRTKAIIVNSPANPSGKVFRREELGWIADLARKHDLFVFTDEIYEYFLYDGAEHISPATLPGMFERTLTFSGFSKTFSITGWRVGYAVGSERWLPAMAYYHDLVYICAPAPFQHGAAAGLNQLGRDFYDGLARDYRKKRDLLCDALRESGFSFSVPRGSYYVLADASNLPGHDSKSKAMYLLEKTGVAAVPGDAFYHDDAGRNLLRFCYAKTDGDLVEACNRLMKLKAAVSVG
jgi:aminotransferase